MRDRKAFFSWFTLWKHVGQSRCVRPKAFGTVSRQYSGHIFRAFDRLCRYLLDSLLPKLFAVTFFCSCLTEPRRAGPWHARRAQQRSVLSMLACGSCPSDSLNIFSHRRSSTTALSSRWGSLLTFGHLCSSRRSAQGRVKIRSASSSSLIYSSIPLSRYKTCLSAVLVRAIR